MGRLERGGVGRVVRRVGLGRRRVLSPTVGFRSMLEAVAFEVLDVSAGLMKSMMFMMSMISMISMMRRRTYIRHRAP